MHRRAEGVQRLAGHADIELEVIAVLFDADALRHRGDQAVGRLSAGQVAARADAIFHVDDARAFCRPARKVHHAGPVQRRQGFGRIIVQALTDHQHRLAVAIAVGIGEGDIGGQRNVARHLFPQVAELVADVPDIVTRRSDRVGVLRRVIAGRPWHHGAADIALAVEPADRRQGGGRRTMEIGRRHHLGMRRRARPRPFRYGRRGRWRDRLRQGGARQQGQPAQGQPAQGGMDAYIHGISSAGLRLIMIALP